MIRARKRFGQHFLEPAWVDKLIAVINPTADDTFLEVGPGRGALTRPLAARCRQVVAYEIDRDLARELREAALANVMIVEGDFLASDFRLQTSNFPLRAVGNLPYNVAAPILFKLVDLAEGGAAIADATVMLQREVADRLVARPGTREYGVLTVLIGHSASAERVLNLPPGAFRPAPKVHSSVVRLRFHPPDPPVRDERFFRSLVQAVFTRRRKTLANALLAVSALGKSDLEVRLRSQTWMSDLDVRLRSQTSKSDLDDRLGSQTWKSDFGGRRPETLTIAEFAALADVFSSR